MNNILLEANKKFRENDYVGALNLYNEIITRDQYWKKILWLNYKICSKKIAETSGDEGSFGIIDSYSNDFQKDLHSNKTNTKQLSERSIKNLNWFGEAFFGPLLGKYFLELREKIKDRGVNKLWFLAREGYFLQRVFKQLSDKLGFGGVETEYLYCSRTFLFKLALAKSDLIPITLRHSYKGKLKQFISDRYGFSTEDIEKLNKLSGLFRINSNNYIDLSRDKSFVIEILNDVSSNFKYELEEKLSIYLSYLKNLGYGSNKVEHLIDVGYAGTIQSFLTDITGISTEGHYLITTEDNYSNNIKTLNGYILNNIVFGSGNMILDKSLYFECILTSPHGQLIDIHECPNKSPNFKFGKIAISQIRFDELEHIINGCVNYILNIDNFENFLSNRQIISYYNTLLSNKSLIPSSIQTLMHIDDSISGNGFLNPIDFYLN